MKKLIFIFSIVTNFLLGQSPSCNASTITPAQVFYAGISSVSTPTSSPIFYLCDNATVYDTTIGVTSDVVVMINPGATYFWKGGTFGLSILWIKTGGTLYIIPTGNPSSRSIIMEPGSTVIDPANLNSMFSNTITCSIITLPTVNCSVGINEINKDKVITKIYPNPNNGSFKLQIDSEIEKGELIVMNSLGQKVHEQKISRGENDINTNGLAKGLYHYVLLQNKEQISNGKVAIE